MAYRRRRFSRRRSFRRRRATPWYNRKYSALQLASKAVKGVSYLRGLVNSELFKRDVNSQFLAVDRNGTVASLVDIPQGDNDGNRTGNSIFVKRVAFNFQVIARQNETQAARIIIFKDSQQIDDSYPNATMLLDAVGTRSAVQSGLNNATVGRFTILANRTVQLSPYKPVQTHRMYVNMRHHVRYNGILGTDIQKGGLYVLVISNGDATDPNDTVDFNYWMRTSYHDN